MIVYFKVFMDVCLSLILDSARCYSLASKRYFIYYFLERGLNLNAGENKSSVTFYLFIYLF